MLSAGDGVGRFAITGAIGAGGMGEVYAARDPELGRGVAIKVLRGNGSGLRLLREAQALAQLSHPNVVAVYDVGVNAGRTYVAMELIDGVTLEAYTRERRPAWRELVGLYVQAAHGLAAAHARSLIHRDFKPSNALVDATGRVRVTDFGLARLEFEDPDPGAAASGTLPSA